jgi:RHS repeat-associated protein
LVLLPMLVIGQTENYTKTTAYKVPTTDGITANDGSGAVTPEKKIVNITYFDGLGRPIQQVAGRQSNTGKDIITHITYDAFGRQSKDYLPYVSSGGTVNYDSNASANVMSFYGSPTPAITGNPNFEATTYPFSEKEFEASPLNRVFKQGAPGTDWALGAGHEIKLDYQTNSANEIKHFKATAIRDPTSDLYDIGLVDNGFYAANELYKTITKDENWTSGNNNNTTEEFKNKEGQVVLKKTYNNGVAHETYYVYDIYGNLTYVIPPLVTNASAQLDDLCYQYKYDYRNRLVEKKLPGKQWEFIVYDRLDRVVKTGPVFAPFTDLMALNKIGWLITKYDAFNRPVYTGWEQTVTVTSADRQFFQNAQNTSTSILNETRKMQTIDGIAAYYTNFVSPMSFKLLTVNYYDDYNLPNVQSPIPTSIEGQPVLVNVKSLPTGSWVRVLTTSSAITGETASTFYDAKARPIRTYLKNYFRGYTQTDSKLNSFSGQLQYTVTTHKRDNTSALLTVKDEFTYSAQDRLLTHTHQINGGATKELLAKNEYDELGQLIVKRVGGNASTAVGLQKVNYSYNIRGWLKGINDITNLNPTPGENDLFSFKLNYNAVAGSAAGVSPLYNGNISETYWRTASDDKLRKYGYEYDHLNRLKNAIYQKPDNAVPVTNSYNESLAYDKNGNIMSLSRTGEFDDAVNTLQMDNLTYEYANNNASNQLIKVTDATNNPNGFKYVASTGSDYSYDANGNMTIDKNKGITAIVYNHLNLPTKITFGTTGTIEYLYNAVGQKLQKKVTEGTNVITTDYLSGFQYSNSILDFFPHAEGYVKNTVVNGNNSYNYVFNYTDHLGNVRLSYGVDPNNTAAIKIMEENNYYPFGLKHNNYNMSRKYYLTYGSGVGISSCNTCPKGYNYKYNGKELQDELGLNWYDYQARNYDPALGRWMNPDPKAETSRRFSPYAYALNNPVYFIDPDGMQAVDNDDPIHNSNGDVIGDDGKSDNKIHIVFDKNVELEIYNQTASGNKAIDLTNKEHVTLNGGSNTVDGVVASVEAQSKNTSNGNGAGLHEEGGNTQKDANGNVQTVSWSPGDTKTGSNNAAINPFNGVTKPSSGSLLDYWHVHTSGSLAVDDGNGTETVFKAAIGPSGTNAGATSGDIPYQAGMEARGYNTTAIQVDTVNKSNNVNFYNGTKVTGTMSLNNFKKL